MQEQLGQWQHLRRLLQSQLYDEVLQGFRNLWGDTAEADRNSLDPMLAELFQPQFGRTWSCLLLEAARQKPGSLIEHLNWFCNPDQCLPIPIALRARTIRLVCGDLSGMQIELELEALLADYRKLWQTECWKEVRTESRPFAWKALDAQSPELAKLLDQVVAESPGGWMDPAAAFLADTLLGIPNTLETELARVSPAQKSEKRQDGRTWMLIAVDDSLKTTPTPGGLLLLLQIESLPNGSATFYPHPEHAAHLMLKPEMQKSFKAAWEMFVGDQAVTADCRQRDYRWRLMVMDDSHTAHLPEKPAHGDLGPQVVWHRRRRLVCNSPLKGRSADVAIAACLRSTIEQTPLDLSRAATGMFDSAKAGHRNPTLKIVEDVALKDLGIDPAEPALRRALEVHRILELVVPASQTTETAPERPLLFAADFESAWKLLSEFSSLTHRFHQVSLSLAREWFAENCFADAEHPRGSYVQNRLLWHEAADQIELTSEQIGALTAGRVTEALTTSPKDPPRRIIKLLADSGWGKTAFLANCQYEISDASGDTVAIRVEHLVDLLSQPGRAGYVDAAVTHVLGLLAHDIDEGYETLRKHVRNWLERKAEAGRILWLLDGFDEMREHQERVRTLAASFPHCSMILALRPEPDDLFCRLVETAQGGEWTSLQLHRYSRKKVREFLGRAGKGESWQQFRTTQYAVEKLGLVAASHRYLASLVERFCWLNLQELDQTESLRIELEKVYIALKADPETDYNRSQEAELHRTEVHESAGQVSDAASQAELSAEITRRTYRPLRDEAKWSAVQEVLNIAEAFRQHRHLVILGHPGSGKSTLGRWLALQMARASASQLKLLKPVSVEVPLYQVNPELELNASGPLVCLGPARVPIFLRVAHFAQELSNRPSLELMEYLGTDPDSTSNDGMSADVRNTLFSNLIEMGAAVVFLDGLDELSEDNRPDVVRKIQKFVDDSIREEEGNGDVPWLVGGTQVVVTSRYVGYEQTDPLRGCVHFGIQAMEPPAVVRFAHSWADAVNSRLERARQRQFVAEAFIREIYSEGRPATEFATNPLLLSILATVFWKDGQLPDRLAKLYQRAVQIQLEFWLARNECAKFNLTEEEVLAALEPLAAELQQSSSSGLTDLGSISNLMRAPLARMRGRSPRDRQFQSTLNALLSTIPKQVGLLSEWGSGNYGFYHRTFQEYLAGRHLVADETSATEQIINKIDDPLWREPLKFALEWVLVDPLWVDARAQLLTDVLNADGADALIPSAALLVLAALRDLRDVSAELVEQMTEQLLNSYAICLDQPQAAALREQIEQAFIRLREGRRANVVAARIVKEIQQRSGERELAAACATLLRRIDWFTTDLVRALHAASDRDERERDWPIHRALIAALSNRPSAVPWLGPAPKLVKSLIDPQLPMRRFLETHPALVGSIRRDADWLWLVVALYGGLGSADLMERHARFREQRLQTAQGFPVSEPLDPAEAEAVDRLVTFCPVQFSPDDIVHDLIDPEMTNEIRDHLVAEKPAVDLVRYFEEYWQSELSPTACAEALLGLAALGQDVVPRLQEALQKPDRRDWALAAIKTFARLLANLREPLVRSSQMIVRTIPNRAPEAHQLDLLDIARELLLANGAGPLRISDRIPEYRFVDAQSPSVRARLDAEYWSYLFSGTEAGGTDAGVHPSGPTGEFLFHSVDRLLHAWSLLGKARNHGALWRLPWPQGVLQPRSDSALEQYLALLDCITHVPRELQFFAGTVLARCQRIVDEHPDLLCETIVVLWSQGLAFREGFLSVRRAFAITERALSALARDGIPETVLQKVRAWKGLEFEDQCQLTRHASATLELDEWEEVRELLMEYATVVTPAAEDAIWSTADEYDAELATIDDPYLRFRAEWRLLGISERRTEQKNEVSSSPTRKTAGGETGSMVSEWSRHGTGHLSPLSVRVRLESFEEPHNGIRACEWILATMPYSRATLGKLIVESSESIRDDENRARTQFRLALYLREHEQALVEKGIASLYKISNPERRAETIREVRAAWDGQHGVSEALTADTGLISDPWLSSKAFGRMSRLVNEYRRDYTIGPLVWRLDDGIAGQPPTEYRRNHLTGTLPWGLVYLSAIASEVKGLAGTSTGTSELSRLLTGERDNHAFSGIERGVQLSAREASVLDRALEGGNGAELDWVWPYLESPTPDAQVTVNRWVSRDDLAGSWSALAQAEAGYLTPQVVEKVIGLLMNSTDRLHMRAALALHGRTAYCQNKNRRWSIQRVGVDTVEMVARHALDSGCSPAVRTSLKWIQHDLHCDAPEALQGWLHQASVDANHPAGWLLRNLESASRDCVPLLIHALDDKSPSMQHTILTTLARLGYCTTILNDSRAQICHALARIPADVRREQRVPRNGPVTLLGIAKQASLFRGAATRLSHIRSLLEPELLWLDEESLSNEVLTGLRLGSLGHQLYIDLSNYWSNARAATADIKDPASVLDILLSWLESEFQTSRMDCHNFGSAEILSHLLTATEAVAHTSPPAFANAADPPELWESILTHCVLTGSHWTARLAAVRLLGRLRRVTDRVVDALCSAMNDVHLVQNAAYETASEFRRVDADILPRLLNLLDDRSAGVAAATARLLTAIARSERDGSDRRRILQALQDAATPTKRTRFVYLMKEDGQPMKIEFVNSLDRLLYAAIIEIREK